MEWHHRWNEHSRGFMECVHFNPLGKTCSIVPVIRIMTKKHYPFLRCCRKRTERNHHWECYSVNGAWISISRHHQIYTMQFTSWKQLRTTVPLVFVSCSPHEKRTNMSDEIEQLDSLLFIIPICSPSPLFIVLMLFSLYPISPCPIQRSDSNMNAGKPVFWIHRHDCVDSTRLRKNWHNLKKLTLL